MDWVLIEGAFWQAANVLVGLPLVGFGVMFAGHVVGTLYEKPSTTVWHKYGLLFGLGFALNALVVAWGGTLFN